MAVQISEVWSDLDHRLIQDSQGTLKKVINVQSVMTSLDNILKTYKGERCMLPEFGSILREVVFELIDSDVVDFVSRDIKEAIEIWDDRINVQEVSFLSDPDTSSISLQVAFSIQGYEQIFKYVGSIRGES